MSGCFYRVVQLDQRGKAGEVSSHDNQPNRNAKRISAERTTSSLKLVGCIIIFESMSLIILEKLTVAHLAKNSLIFMKINDLLPCSKEFTTGACPERHQCRPPPQTIYL
jgi:hypothetical protein